ncbi:MAG: response regulator transcription factor [Mycobacteriales bacterium]
MIRGLAGRLRGLRGLTRACARAVVRANVPGVRGVPGEEGAAMRTVLVVDDNISLRDAIAGALVDAGYRVEVAATGAEALELLAGCVIDLVVLDIMLPDLDGLSILAVIRRRPGWLPVILLTALDRPEDELAGWTARADHYVTKPVSLKLLVARVEACLAANQVRTGEQFRVGLLSVNLAKREASGPDGDLVELTPREFDLLAFLATHPDRAHHRDRLLAAVWGAEYGGTARTLDTHISRLRQVIERNSNSPVYLKSIPRVGYMLRLKPSLDSVGGLAAGGLAGQSDSEASPDERSDPPAEPGERQVEL